VQNNIRPVGLDSVSPFQPSPF